MAIVWRWVFACAVLLVTVSPLRGAPAGEKGVFDAALGKFHDGFFEYAEADFGGFIQKFPASSRVPEAVLYQAQARIKLTNYVGALELLTTNQPQAGALADQYLFWQADALFQKGDFAASAKAFGRLVGEFPGSARRLEASVRQAAALSKLSDWTEVLALLAPTNGLFQSLARTNTGSELVPRGYLLLAEAQLAKGLFDAAEATLQPLTKLSLNPQLNWQRQFLFCRVLLAQNRLQDALQNTTNLQSLASAADQRSFQAESTAFHARLLERLGRPDEAAAILQRNLEASAPVEYQSQASLKLAELLLAKNKIAEAAQILEKFLTQHTNAASADLALLTLGELRLRECEGIYASEPAPAATNAPALTNCLAQALAAFDAFTNRFPESPLSGKAHFGLGWCYWLCGKLPESRAAFQAAVQRLAPSPEQAEAYFKLADCEFRLNQPRNAMTNYAAVAEKFGAFPELRTNLFEPALYQQVRAALAADDLQAATNALARIVSEYPDGFHTDRAVLLTGQQLGRQAPAQARQLFLGFLGRATNSPQAPEVKLAVARTYENEQQWPEAIREYDQWLGTFTNHQSQARAEYSRAYANFQAGYYTNALLQFTNFIAHFPTNECAPLAQWWVADYWYSVGNFPEAEMNYEWCYLNTNWPPSELTYQAMLMAGRAAVARQGWKDARVYFVKLAGNTNLPPDLRAEALFAYGDYWMSCDSTNKLADYGEAISTFDRIVFLYPTNPIAVLAIGEKASCLLQSALLSQDYGPATNAFQQVIDSPLADAAARSIAKVGLGLALEKSAQSLAAPQRTELLKLALRQYLDVFYPDDFLRPGEKPDPFWTRKAGLEAERLAEALQMRAQAINVYERLQQLFPPLRLETKIKALKAAQELDPKN